MEINLDTQDKAIIHALQEDSSISNLELSKKIGLSPSACLTRTKNLKEQGVIKQYTAFVDEKKLGVELIAFTMVNLSPLNREVANHFLATINEIPNVLECYTVTGSRDFLLKVVAKDIATFRDFIIDTIMAIPGVDKVETSIVMNRDKCTLTIPIDQD
ncbi:AsnC family transcriptional regulator [Desulfitobacterium sp. LBE]|uniref:Transcriptional regulator AzlB n=1 Tax=Desulfitobacterium hafniense DP7 TaxID=537010 RepID=G9XKS7_DESHA|nr:MULTISPECIES: Lrp/AsnC family transcriptional regulator [Desulfitobacterium]EHL07754.1 transcriptional regulator AzlB [Desulfitobacterium hafniense DP7]TWH60650.1 AsnC family transcriptional regulator [Desulfitobacterium sp. LBE]